MKEGKPAAIRVHALKKNYGNIEAVRGIDLEVHEGEIFGLIGPDGAGKTTTFQILAGVMQATGGDVRIFNKSARESRSVVGYLTQSFSLYPDLSVDRKHPLRGRSPARAAQRNHPEGKSLPGPVRHGSIHGSIGRTP